MLQPACCDVLAVVHAFKTDLHDGVVGAFDCLGQVAAAGCYSKYPPTRRVEAPVTIGRSGMKDFSARNAIRLVDTSDSLPRFKGSGIASRGHHDAHRRVSRPAEIAFADSPFD